MFDVPYPCTRALIQILRTRKEPAAKELALSFEESKEKYLLERDIRKTFARCKKVDVDAIINGMIQLAALEKTKRQEMLTIKYPQEVIDDRWPLKYLS